MTMHYDIFIIFVKRNSGIWMHCTIAYYFT